MGAIRREMRLLDLPIYMLARRVQMPEDRLKKMLKGRVKNVTDGEIDRIATALSMSPDKVRADIEEQAQDRREEVARIV